MRRNLQHLPLAITTLWLVCAAHAADVVYEKRLSANQFVEVIRTPIPDKAPSRENEESLKVTRPDRFTIPDGVYEYALQFKGNSNDTGRTIWKTEFKHWNRGPAIPSNFEVLDIAASAPEQILLLMKAGASTGCHFIPTSTNSSTLTQPISQDLFGDKAALGKVVISGRCIVTNATLVGIELKLANKSTSQWRWSDGKLTEEPPARNPKGTPIAPLPPIK